jgi:hypothetical protein
MPGTDELTLPVEVVYQRVHLVDHLIVRTAQEPAWQPVEHRADLDGPAGVLLLRDCGGDELGLHWRSPPYVPIRHHCRVLPQPGQPVLGTEHHRAADTADGPPLPLARASGSLGLVAGVVDTVMFAVEVETPGRQGISAGDQGAELTVARWLWLRAGPVLSWRPGVLVFILTGDAR